MGPYCKFCDQRCFVPFPINTPEHILRAYRNEPKYRSVTIIATCTQGQAFEKNLVGFCYDDVLEAVKVIRMDAETKEALAGSIDKWDREEVVDCGGLNCPLCDQFAWNCCLGCPVMEATGMDGCKGTPYEEWMTHMVQAHPEQNDTDSWITVPGCAECIRIQKAEADFLKSLREE